MKARCYKPTAHNYPRYGGRGITVCERWLNSFENFLADMGDKPDGKTLDRVDNDKNYEPGNCRWETRKRQQRNQSTTVFLTYKGETKSRADWAEQYGLSIDTLRGRIAHGWPDELWFVKPGTHHV